MFLPNFYGHTHAVVEATALIDRQDRVMELMSRLHIRSRQQVRSVAEVVKIVLSYYLGKRLEAHLV
jgi:hypothetical protein